MANFFIKRITATGENVAASSLDFTEGLNIICGPSNTGKSYVLQCIDFMFGSSAKPFDESTGYDTVQMVVQTKEGQTITLERCLGKTTTQVFSTVSGIESGKYGGGQSKQRLSDLWLSLIGIDEETKIVSNQHFNPQTLTWRTFLHSFLISEDNVFQKQSIITKAGYYEKTASLSALLYLISGKDFGEFTTQDTPEIKKARKKAKSDYINEKLSELSERHGKIADTMSALADVNIDAQMQALIDRITETENSITTASRRSRRLLEQIYDTSAKIEESEYLQDRYIALETQYLSDLKRLQFIVDGESKSGGTPQNTRCPFCDGDLPDHEHASYIEASLEEIKAITAKLEDLHEVTAEVSQDKTALESRLFELKTENDGVIDLINNELEPLARELKTRLNEYRIIVEMRHEMDVLQALSDAMNADLGAIEQDNESEALYKPREHFGSDFIDKMSTYITDMLKACKYEHFLTARFSIDTFDAVTNGKKKENEGKGFRAFLNTAVAFTLMRYLAIHGKYAPKLLIIDSPILSLKERGSEKATDSMKTSLFNYLLKNQQYGQMIVIENDIPEIDYGDTNVIRFTMDETEGRYGFLSGVRN